MPETAKNKVDAIKTDSNRLGGEKAKPPVVIQTGGNRKGPSALPASVQGEHQKMVSTDISRISSSQIRLSGCFIQTKEVSPGESLELVLSIIPIGRLSPQGSFAYSVKSQQIPLEKLDREAPEVNSKGVVYFKDVAPWRYWFPPVLNGMIIFMELLGLVYFMTLIWL
jgi:hypothetical protein